MNKRRLFKIVAYYIIAIVLVVLLNVLPGFKSGPCTPNFDFFSILFLGIASFALTIKSIYSWFASSKRSKSAIAIHGGVYLTWFLLLFIGI